MALCFATFQGWGRDATLRTGATRRRDAAGANWRQEWDECFSDDVSEPAAFRAAYQEVMTIFSRDIGLNSERPGKWVGDYPADAT